MTDEQRKHLRTFAQKGYLDAREDIATGNFDPAARAGQRWAPEEQAAYARAYEREVADHVARLDEAVDGPAPAPPQRHVHYCPRCNWYPTCDLSCVMPEWALTWRATDAGEKFLVGLPIECLSCREG